MRKNFTSEVVFSEHRVNLSLEYQIIGRKPVFSKAWK